MNILIYVPDIAQDWGGIRQYSVAMLRILSSDKRNKYFIYHNVNDPEVTGLIDKNDNFYIVKDSDVSESRIKQKINRARYLMYRIQQKAGFNTSFSHSLVIDRLCVKYKIDIVHSPYQYLPITNRAKLVFTLHDVQELHFPQFFSAEERASRAVNYLNYIRRSDKIVVSYSHVKKDAIKYFLVEENKIHVILLNMDKLWFEQFIGKDLGEMPSYLSADPYILYPANTWEHKNHVKLIESIALLRDRDGVIVKLICSGHRNTYFEEVIDKRIKELSLENQVSFIGVVDELTLYTLYKRSLGVVAPTLYEAGSFPLMESILLNIPVVCSNVTSLPDTIGNDKFVFDPHNVGDIAEKIKLLWTSDSYRNNSIDNTYSASVRIKNTHALENFLSLYEQL